MMKIRSVHPGLWSDARFARMSPFARLLTIGLWNIADDRGCFRWDPETAANIVLMRDDVDAEALFDEIARAGFIRRYDVGGRGFGAIKNFRRYQKVRRFVPEHPAPAEIRDYVGEEMGAETAPRPAEICDDGIAPTTTSLVSSVVADNCHQCPDMSGHVRLERRGEERRDKGSTPPAAAARAPDETAVEPIRPAAAAAPDAGRRVIAAMGIDWADPSWTGTAALVWQWLDNGWDLDLDILPVVTAQTERMRKRGDPPRSLAVFTSAIASAHRQRLTAVDAAKALGNRASVVVAFPGGPHAALLRDGWEATSAHFEILCRTWFVDNTWQPTWGPKPGEAGSFVPEAYAADAKTRMARKVF